MESWQKQDRRKCSPGTHEKRLRELVLSSLKKNQGKANCCLQYSVVHYGGKGASLFSEVLSERTTGKLLQGKFSPNRPALQLRPRGTEQPPQFLIFKTWLDKALSNLIKRPSCPTLSSWLN